MFRFIHFLPLPRLQYYHLFIHGEGAIRKPWMDGPMCGPCIQHSITHTSRSDSGEKTLRLEGAPIAPLLLIWWLL
jgi:hypothetical protein